VYTSLVQYYATVKKLHPHDFETTDYYRFWRIHVPSRFWKLRAQEAKAFVLHDDGVARELHRLWNEEAHADFESKCSVFMEDTLGTF
jgi:hypothetical protein